MFFRNKEDLKILSHKNIISLNYYDQTQFLKLYFNELRSYLLPVNAFNLYKNALEQFPLLLDKFKHFWVALADCSSTSDGPLHKKSYLAAEKNIFILYHALATFRKKYYIQKIETFFHALHLVIKQCYPGEKIPAIKFKLPKEIIEENKQTFCYLKKVMTAPLKPITDFTHESLQKEFAILFSLYQKEHFTPDALCKLKEDIVATTQRYPFIQHARILEDFYKKLGKCP